MPVRRGPKRLTLITPKSTPGGASLLTIGADLKEILPTLWPDLWVWTNHVLICERKQQSRQRNRPDSTPLLLLRWPKSSSRQGNSYRRFFRGLLVIFLEGHTHTHTYTQTMQGVIIGWCWEDPPPLMSPCVWFFAESAHYTEGDFAGVDFFPASCIVFVA